MPPSLSRSSLSSLAHCRCPAITMPNRPFTTSSSQKAIGPVNPKFIEIPVAPQAQAFPKRDIKGTLPPPRNLFPADAPNKTSKEYLAATTPEPKYDSEPANDLVAWKRRMAASRREHLREGLVELYKRKKKQDQKVISRGKRRHEEREQRLNARQREDERLTNPTIKEVTKTVQSGPIPDPNRAARVAEKAAIVQAREKAKEEQRRDALHTLYMQARSFITSEEQLNAEIEKIFVPLPWENSRSDNIWEATGSPPTVQDMLSTTNNTQKSALAFHAGPAIVTGHRMKKIAEELTGGKMD